jgi:hypothetical protein
MMVQSRGMKTRIEYDAEKQHWDLWINGVWENSFRTEELAKRAARRIAMDMFHDKSDSRY